MSAPTLRKYFRDEFLSGKKVADTPAPSRPVTDALREKVVRYLGYSMSAEEIALAIGYRADGEFEKFLSDYALELRIGKAVTRAETIDQLIKQSAGGLIGATNKLEALSRPAGAKDAAGSAPTEHVGKKAAAQQKANEIANQLRPIGPPTLKAVK